MGIVEVSTEFIPHDTYTSPHVAASTDTKGKRGNRIYDGGDTHLAGHDLTDIWSSVASLHPPAPCPCSRSLGQAG